MPERVTYTSHALTVQLAAAAALTERVRLWTTLIVLPAHNAVQVAKDMASVDQVCGGRLTVAVGVGGREQDYRAIGGDFTNRWARMDAQVAEMRSIWDQHPPFEGSDPVGPPPVQAGGPPLVAGVVGPEGTGPGRSLGGRRRRSHCHHRGGWRGLAAQREKVLAAWKEAGRNDQPHFSTSLWYALGPDAKAAAGRLHLRLPEDLRPGVCPDDR